MWIEVSPANPNACPVNVWITEEAVPDCKVTKPETEQEGNNCRVHKRRTRLDCYKCGRVGHLQYNCYNCYQPESPSQKQEDSQEFHAHYNQDENQRLAAYPSARVRIRSSV